MALGFIKRIWNSQKLLFTNSCAEDNSEYATSLEGETLVEEDKPIIFYRGCKDKDKVRVVLIFQTATCWPSWKSLYTSLADKDEFEVVVIHAPWENQSNRLKMYNEARLLLITVGIPFIPSTHFSIENFKPHVVFVQTPYEDYLPEEFKLDELLACQCRIAYIPYGIEIGGGITNLNYQFNLDLHKKAWKIFARSSRHLAMYSKYNPAGSSNVVDLGHPRVDSYPDLAGISIDKKFETIPSEKKSGAL